MRVQVREQEHNYHQGKLTIKISSKNTIITFLYIFKVVVIIVIWIISLLVIYMLFLVCLDPFLNKKTATQYQEHNNEEVITVKPQFVYLKIHFFKIVRMRVKGSIPNL